MLVIRTPPCFGDHVICNGIVRYYYKRHGGPIKIFCSPAIHSQVCRLYADIKDDIIIAPEKPPKVFDIDAHGEWKKQRMWRTGETFDEIDYASAGVPFAHRFLSFYYPRDRAAEKAAYNKLVPRGSYIYVNDDPDKGYHIDPAKHRADLPIVRNDKSIDIVDKRLILESATEIHTMQTGLLDLCNSIPLRAKVFIHLYVRDWQTKHPTGYIAKAMERRILVT